MLLMQPVLGQGLPWPTQNRDLTVFFRLFQTLSREKIQTFKSSLYYIKLYIDSVMSRWKKKKNVNTFFALKFQSMLFLLTLYWPVTSVKRYIFNLDLFLTFFLLFSKMTRFCKHLQALSTSWTPSCLPLATDDFGRPGSSFIFL